MPGEKNFLTPEQMKDKEEKLRLFSSLLKAYEISESTVEIWGEDSQLVKAVEECAEFIVALFHAKAGKVSNVDLASEIADVMIIAMAAARSVGVNLVIGEMEKKLEKLNLRLENSPQSDESKNWSTFSKEVLESQGDQSNIKRTRKTKKVIHKNT